MYPLTTHKKHIAGGPRQALKFLSKPCEPGDALGSASELLDPRSTLQRSLTHPCSFQEVPSFPPLAGDIAETVRACQNLALCAPLTTLVCLHFRRDLHANFSCLVLKDAWRNQKMKRRAVICCYMQCKPNTRGDKDVQGLGRPGKGLFGLHRPWFRTQAARSSAPYRPLTALWP